MLLNGKEGTGENKNKAIFSKFHGTVGHAEKVFSSGSISSKKSRIANIKWYVTSHKRTWK